MKTLTHIEKDIINHLLDELEYQIGEHKEDLHHNIFNADYFITGYYVAERWLKDNDIHIFDGIKYCQEMEDLNFGEIQTTFDNPETLANHYAYWKGQELINSLECFDDLNVRLHEEDIEKIKNEIWSYYKLPF